MQPPPLLLPPIPPRATVTVAVGVDGCELLLLESAALLLLVLVLVLVLLLVPLRLVACVRYDTTSEPTACWCPDFRRTRHVPGLPCTRSIASASSRGV